MFYTPKQVSDILLVASQKQLSSPRYKQFERMGILMSASAEDDDKEVNKDIQDNFICSVCKKKLMSLHYLSLHVSETHDSYFKVQSEKKPSVSSND